MQSVLCWQSSPVPTYTLHVCCGPLPRWCTIRWCQSRSLSVHLFSRECTTVFVKRNPPLIHYFSVGPLGEGGQKFTWLIGSCKYGKFFWVGYSQPFWSCSRKSEGMSGNKYCTLFPDLGKAQLLFPDMSSLFLEQLQNGCKYPNQKNWPY